jgi:DNA-directed RNA polymerase specialized sigma54-like protein
MQLQRPSFIQTQQLKMNPQLFLSIKLMELPIMDLRETIEEEIERNPALEVLEDRGTVSLDEAIGSSKEKEEEDYFEATSDPGFTRQGGEEAADEQRRFIEGILSRPETLQQHLLWQLQVEPVDDELRAIAEVLIQNLDEDGFHKEPPETLFKDGPPPRFVEALRFVRGLDPAGTCTADYRESLLVQTGLLPDAPQGIEEALDHLDLLEKGRFAEAAKKMNRGEAEARVFFERIKGLSPFPGRRFATTASEVRYVVPDIQVSRDEGEFVIILNDETIPVLGINPFFMKIAESGRKTKTNTANLTTNNNDSTNGGSGGPKDEGIWTTDEKATGELEGVGGMAQKIPDGAGEFDDINEVKDDDGLETGEESDGGQEYVSGTADRPARDFVRENIREARWFIQSVNQRNHTLLRVTRAILEFQRPFFVDGPKYLAPLTLADIAGELGLHETTISRTANGKYVQTEWGIFELRYFFSNSISGPGSGGSRYSKAGVKAVIQEIVAAENKRLSDQDIVGLLAQRGIPLARRTVGKYRKELDMGSSYTRRAGKK